MSKVEDSEERSWVGCDGETINLELESDDTVSICYLESEYRFEVLEFLDILGSTKDIEVTVEDYLIFSKYNTTLAIIDRCNGKSILVDDYMMKEMVDWIKDKCS